MTNIKRNVLQLLMGLVLLVGVVALAACSAEEGESEDTNPATDSGDVDVEQGVSEEDEGLEPVELLMEYHRDDFEDTIKKPVEEEYPHITLKQINPNEDDMDQLYASGIVPDIVAKSAHVLHHLIDDEIAYDLSELVEQNNFDLSRLEPGFLQFMRDQADGDLIALPYKIGMGSGLFYNKDIFDQFAVPYPEDGMTWNEVVDIAKDLTREEDGVQYRGLDLDLFALARNQLEVPPIDVETGKPTFTEREEWVMLLELFKEVIEIPGNYDHVPEGEFGWNYGYDFRQGNVAMQTGKNQTMNIIQTEDLGFDWDVVSFPVWEHKPDVAPPDFEFALAISRYSEQIDEAWRVIEFLLSAEHQEWLAKEGITIPVIADMDIREQLYENVPEVQDKNIEAFTYHSFGTQVQAPPGYPFLRIDQTELREFFDSSHRDPVTFLRELQEQGETEILEYQKQN